MGYVRISNHYRDLRKYLRYGHHESIVTTVDNTGKPNTAPMGVKLVSNIITLKPYVTTRTYANILNVREVMVNITADSLLYYYALFNPERIRYGNPKIIKPPRVLGGVDLYIECVVEDIALHDEVALVSLKPLCWYRGSGSKLAFSRANSSVIEALIHYTKLPYLISSGDLEGVRYRYVAIEAARNIVMKVGNDVLKKVIDDILNKSMRLISKAGITV